MNLAATLTGLAPDALTPEVQRAFATTAISMFVVGYVFALHVAKRASEQLERARLGMKPMASQGVGPSRKARP